jgi:hypothetical protein
MPLGCPFGNIQINDYGLNAGIVDSDCKQVEHDNCDDVRRDLNWSGCTTHQSCQVNLSNLFIAGGDALKKERCQDSSTFWVQYSCIQGDAEADDKKQDVLVSVVIGTLVCMLFSTTIYYLRQYGKIQAIQWDCQTITAGDYTAELDITDEGYDWYLKNVKDKYTEDGCGGGEGLKLYLMKELEELLTKNHKGEGIEKRSEIKKQGIDIKIADIAFAYDNAELIKLLRTRGQHIVNQRFDKQKEVEQEISDLKNQSWETFTKPVCAFITFEEEDGYNRALDYEPFRGWSGKLQYQDQDFLGGQQKLVMIPATEPTNIIWENREIEGAEKIKRLVISVLIIVALISASFTVILLCKQYSIKVSSKYPTVDCGPLKDSYGDNYEYWAKEEWKAYYTPMMGGKKREFTGVLPCFCKDQQAIVGITKIRTWESEAGGDKIAICKENFDDFVNAFAWSNAVKYLIIGINYFLRLVLVKIVYYMGKQSQSEQTELVTNVVFTCQFFNTAILLMLVNANLGPQGIPILSDLFTGNISDFDDSWFNDIGNTLIGAMIFNIYFPVIEFVGFWFMRFGFRFLDRGCSLSSNSTKKVTIQQYANLYMGPVYLIHYKYSSMLNITFVTFMYGFGMPILFPIAAMSITTLYLVEKCMVYWSYRQPPTYDSVLNNSVLDKMTWAPFFYLIFGYWMLTNPTLFGNSPVKVDVLNGGQGTDHYWTSFFSFANFEKSVAMPFYVMSLIFLVGIFFRNFLWNCVTYVIPMLRVGNLHLDENLPNYYETLDEQDQDWLIKEEENVRSALKFNLLTTETLDKIKSRKMCTKTL